MPGWDWAFDQLGYTNALHFDEWLDRRLPYADADALIAISGAGLKRVNVCSKTGVSCVPGSTYSLAAKAVQRGMPALGRGCLKR